MRIKQFLCITGRHFEKGFIEKYGFIPYTNINEPLFISGFGREIFKNLDRISKHKSLIVLRWAGGDLMWFLKHPAQMERIKGMKNVRHIAISRCLEKDLQQAGVPYKFLPISVYKNDDIKPRPLGDSVYIYKFSGAQHGSILNSRIEKLLPEFTFVKTEGVSDHCREELIDIYNNCFLGLRFTEHDGLSNTAVELGLMGRRIIWNGDLPSAIFWKNDVQSIVQLIRNEYENRKNLDPYKTAAAVKEYLNVGTAFLNTEFYD
jgi:hypothetical protein